jgi:hypothetical protein
MVMYYDFFVKSNSTETLKIPKDKLLMVYI